MAYEDVDCCLRAWEAGLRVVYYPARHARRTSSRQTRGDRARRARARLAAALLGALGRLLRRARRAHAPTAALRDRLRHRGHRRRRRPPRHLRAPQPARGARPRRRALHARRAARLVRPRACPMRTFEDYDELVDALAQVDAIKVATWWNTAAPVWRASVRARHPGLLRPGHRDVLLPRRRARLRHTCSTLPPGVPLHDDLRLEPRAPARAGPRRRARSRRASTSRPSARSPTCERRDDMLLALGRTNPLKNLPLTLDAWRALARRRGPSCACSASSPSSAREHGARYVERAERRGGQRAAQPGDRVRADLDARGLLPAAARGDGDRRRGRLHRRPRQPRLLRRRRQLPDARADARVGQRRARSGCSATRSCASGSARRASRRRADYAWERRIDELEAFFARVASGALRGPRRSRGAARLKTQKPSANVPATIPSGTQQARRRRRSPRPRSASAGVDRPRGGPAG